MRYMYIVAWTIRGGVGLPKDVASIELVSSPSARAILTRDPDDLLEPLNLRDALAAAFAEAFRGRSVIFHEYAASHLEDVVAKRKKREQGETLVCIFTGEEDVVLDKKWVERDGYIMCLDVVDNRAIARRHGAEEEALKTALSLESPTRFLPLTQGVYLTNVDGVPVYNLSSDMCARLSVMTPLDKDAPRRVQVRYRALLATKGLQTVRSLSAQVTDSDNDRLREFLAGWGALEALVERAFKERRSACDAQLSAAENPVVARYLEGQRKTQVPSLSGKFAAVLGVALPDAPEAEALADYSSFCAAQGVRNDLYHGNCVVPDDDLPVSDVTRLLSKYLRGYLELESRSPASRDR